MLQTRTVEPGTLELLKNLMSLPELDGFYLVGGTALALQFGHRMSVDLDLFTELQFDKVALLEALQKSYDVLVETEEGSMLITSINFVKVDFVKMSYPVLFAPIVVEGVRMLEIRDIAPMKLKAVTQRGSKKDFYDIYYLLDYLTIQQMLELFSLKFRQFEIFHVLKSLNYFDDAEKYPDPVLFDKTVTWNKVKSKIQSAIKSHL
jgi:predicted nucleotidyltransferase component of viral defense system